MHFKPTQRKNGAIVLAIHGPGHAVNPGANVDAPAPDVDQAGEQTEDTYPGKKQRKRHHSTFSPAAASTSAPSAKGKAGRKSKKH
ncbi:hypothetical protein ABW21_db0206832 [Orbilia brochopaga]|nr:hypothetical protein ABW21_db0206832 [Drechslerella brochopaga]